MTKSCLWFIIQFELFWMRSDWTEHILFLNSICKSLCWHLAVRIVLLIDPLWFLFKEMCKSSPYPVLRHHKDENNHSPICSLCRGSVSFILFLVHCEFCFRILALSSHSVVRRGQWWHPTLSPLYDLLDHTNQIFSESLWHPLSTDPPTTRPLHFLTHQTH